MTAFWADAQSIFATARQALLAGSPDCDLAILIGPQGDIRMLDAAGWALPNLAVEYGARAAYRVTRERGRVKLEGRCGLETCLFSVESPAASMLPFRGSVNPANRRSPALLPPAAQHTNEEIWTTSA